MGRKSFLIAGLAAVIGLAGLTKIYAAPKADAPGERRMLAKLRADLSLTGEQKKQLRQLVVAHRTEIAAAMRPVVEDRRALREAALSETVDEAAVRAAADKLGKDLGEAALLVGKLRKEAVAILTPEQLKTLGDFGDDVATRVDALLERLESGGPR